MAFRDVSDKVDALRHIVGAEELAEENKEKGRVIAQLRKEKVDLSVLHEYELRQKDDTMASLENMLNIANQRNILYNGDTYDPEGFEALVDEKFNEEVERRIKKAARKMYKADIDGLVRDEVERYPECRSGTRRIIDTAVNKKTATILKSRPLWPAWFTEYFSKQVRIEANRLKDQEYWITVETGVNEKLETIKDWEWRIYLDAYWSREVEPRLREKLQNLIISLQETFEIPCKRCGEVIEFRLTPDNLADTIRGKPVTIVCQYCRGVLGRPYRFKVGLGEILWYLTEGWISRQHAPRTIDMKWRKVESGDKEESET